MLHTKLFTDINAEVISTFVSSSHFLFKAQTSPWSHVWRGLSFEKDMLYFQTLVGEFSMREAQTVGIPSTFGAHERQKALISKSLRKGGYL
jgi:hypothetical protein